MSGYVDHVMPEYEQAARMYCAVFGSDPDELVPFSDGSGHAVSLRRRQWMNVAEEMIKLDLMLKCIEAQT